MFRHSDETNLYFILWLVFIVVVFAIATFVLVARDNENRHACDSYDGYMRMETDFGSVINYACYRLEDGRIVLYPLEDADE